MTRKNKNNKRKYKIDFKYNLSEYWTFVKKYKFLMIIVILGTIIAESLSVANNYLFKIIIDKGESYLSGTILDNAFIDILLIIALVFIGITLFKSFLQWSNIHFQAKMNSNLIYDVRKKYMAHIIRLSHNFHTTHKTGSLISRITRGSGAIDTITDIFAGNFLVLFSQLIVVGASLLYFNIASAITLALTVLAFISYSLFILNIQQSTRLRFINSDDREKGFISDIFMNIDSVKYFGKENRIISRWKKIGKNTKNYLFNTWGYYRWFDAGQTFIVGIGLFFLMYFPIQAFLAGNLSLGTLTFIFTVYGNMVGPMYGFVWSVRSFYKAMADIQDLFEYGKYKNDIKDNSNAKNLKIKNGRIEFENINFHYGKKEAFSLNNFNLHIKPNQKVAFVGHSGCGKTTLVKLLYRFYDVQKGRILLDKKDIRNFKQDSVRSELSIVPQEAILFDDTLFNNIKFSNPKATNNEVWKAIKSAQLDKFVEKLPKKEKTIVGERGVKLSGGEKQRVSIARAILADKKILILDEATSALDSETESEIQKALNSLLKGRTSILIAHRLSTIMNADRIIVMKKGRIIQDGTHEELIRQEGEYKKLWNLQKGGYIKQ